MHARRVACNHNTMCVSLEFCNRGVHPQCSTKNWAALFANANQKQSVTLMEEAFTAGVSRLFCRNEYSRYSIMGPNSFTSLGICILRKAGAGFRIVACSHSAAQVLCRLPVTMVAATPEETCRSPAS